MSETNNKPATTEKKADNKPGQPKKKKPANKTSPWLMPLIILALLIIGGGYKGWQYYQQQQQHSSYNFSQLAKQIDTLSRKQKYQSDNQQTQLDALTEKHNDLKRSFAELLKSSGHLKNDWLLAEAEYLVKLANHRLIMEKDITTAIAAMEAADERLRAVADPALLEVRKVLLEQTQALRAVEQPDLSGMALQLSALKTQIPQLAMKTPDPATVQQRAKEPSKASRVESWSELPKAMWEDLKGLITIRDHSQAVQPLIPPGQHYFLKQNLNLQLEQARLALLKSNNNLYADSLKTAIDWIERHFDMEQKTTLSLLEGLKALSGKNIAPNIPDVSRSYRVLQQYRVHGLVPKPKKPAQKKKKETKEPANKVTPSPEKQPAEKPASPKPAPSRPAVPDSKAPSKVEI